MRKELKGWIDPKKPFSEYDSTGQIVNTGDITDKDLVCITYFGKSFI